MSEATNVVGVEGRLRRYEAAEALMAAGVDLIHPLAGHRPPQCREAGHPWTKRQEVEHRRRQYRGVERHLLEVAQPSKHQLAALSSSGLRQRLMARRFPILWVQASPLATERPLHRQGR
jgi:hypothetical protein